jgi:hypothetical protein
LSANKLGGDPVVSLFSSGRVCALVTVTFPGLSVRHWQQRRHISVCW